MRVITIELSKVIVTHYSKTLIFVQKFNFNIASEASYVYIVSGQKLMKKGQK